MKERIYRFNIEKFKLKNTHHNSHKFELEVPVINSWSSLSHLLFYLKNVYNIAYISPSSVHWRDLETMANPVATNIINGQIVVLKCHFPLKETRASWRNDWFWSEAQNVENWKLFVKLVRKQRPQGSCQKDSGGKLKRLPPAKDKGIGASKMITGASLVVQWLRICLPMQGTRVRALVQEDPTCCGATKPVSHNYWSPHG